VTSRRFAGLTPLADSLSTLRQPLRFGAESWQGSLRWRASTDRS